MSPEFVIRKEESCKDVSEMERVLSGLYRLKANGNRHLNEQAGIIYSKENDLANEAFSSIALAVLLGKFEQVNIGLTIKLIVADYLKRSDITGIEIDDLYKISPNGGEIKNLHSMFNGDSSEAKFARDLVAYNRGFVDGEWKSERIEFLEKLNILKKLERTGWIKRNIKDGYRETVGEHIFGTVVMGLFFGSGDLNDQDCKLPVLMTIHDMAECIVGDVAPDDSRFRSKHKIEKEAMEYLFRKINPDIIELFNEYEDKENEFGKKAKGIDKTETLFQVHLYEMIYKDTDFDSFWTGPYTKQNYEDIQFFINYLKEKSLYVLRNSGLFVRKYNS